MLCYRKRILLCKLASLKTTMEPATSTSPSPGVHEQGSTEGHHHGQPELFIVPTHNWTPNKTYGHHDLDLGQNLPNYEPQILLDLNQNQVTPPTLQDLGVKEFEQFTPETQVEVNQVQVQGQREPQDQAQPEPLSQNGAITLDLWDPLDLSTEFPLSDENLYWALQYYCNPRGMTPPPPRPNPPTPTHKFRIGVRRGQGLTFWDDEEEDEAGGGPGRGHEEKDGDPKTNNNNPGGDGMMTTTNGQGSIWPLKWGSGGLDGTPRAPPKKRGLWRWIRSLGEDSNPFDLELMDNLEARNDFLCKVLMTKGLQYMVILAMTLVLVKNETVIRHYEETNRTALAGVLCYILLAYLVRSTWIGLHFWGSLCCLILNTCLMTQFFIGVILGQHAFELIVTCVISVALAFFAIALMAWYQDLDAMDVTETFFTGIGVIVLMTTNLGVTLVFYWCPPRILPGSNMIIAYIGIFVPALLACEAFVLIEFAEIHQLLQGFRLSSIPGPYWVQATAQLF